MGPLNKSGIGVILAFAVLALWPVSHRTLTPKILVGAPRVIDGDTLALGDQRIRLAGIDAPERAQSCALADGRDWRCGAEATSALVRFLAGRPIACEARGHDPYDRVVALCRADGSDLGAWMVRSGWAVADHGTAFGYTEAENNARFLRLGLWAGPFERPADWRRDHR